MRRQTTLAAAFSLVWVGAAAPVSRAADSQPPQAAESTLPAAGTLRFRLFFDDSADLDLYVTGPLLETVYYGNTPAGTGGSLAEDLRCDSPPGPRGEAIEFPEALPGRYRVGVDFPERCGSEAAPAAFHIAVDGGGVQIERSGEIELGVFEASVFEFDYEPGP